MPPPTELFPLGEVEVYPGAAAALAAAGMAPSAYLARHQAGDWGTADPEANEFAVRHGHGVRSVYPLPDGSELVVVTAFDRSHTGVFLVSEEEDRFVSTREGYAVWAEFYDREKNGLIAVEEPRVVDLLAGLPIGTALDAATGTGRHALRLARRGVAVAAIDQSPEMLAVAQEKAGREGLAIDFRLGKIDERLPFESGQFDLVICALALTHDVDLHAAVGEFHRVLRPGGYLLVTDWHPDCVTVLGWRTSIFAPRVTYVLPNAGHSRDAYLAALASTGFGIETVEDITMGEVPEGYLPWSVTPEEEHTPWCLVILARKPGAAP